MKKSQFIGGILVIIVLAVFANYLAARNSSLALSLITGLMLGYVFSRSRFGFAGSVRKIYFTGDGSLSKALILMLLITIIATSGIHFAAAQKGGLPAFRAEEGDMIIPGSGFVQKASLNVLIGGFIFGIGMIFGGCCASGTLTDVGEGEGRALVVLPFFGLGGILGALHGPFWKGGIFQEVGLQLYLPDVFGYVGTVLIYIVAFFLIYLFIRSYENKRRAQGRYNAEVYEDWQKPLEDQSSSSLFGEGSFHKFFVQRWSFTTAALLIALLYVFIVNTTGTGWGASGPYSLWAMWGLGKLGLNFTAPQLQGQVEAVAKGLMNNGVSLRNIGIMAGALVAMLLAGRFSLNFRFNLKDALLFAFGGLMMGYGASLAGGCNAGALYSGLANFSLSGWFFLLAMVSGGILGSKMYLSIYPQEKI